MQEESVQAENELWDAVGEALDMEMSTVEDVLESLARTQKGNVKFSIENCMTILYRDPVLKDAICKNELTNKIDIVKSLYKIVMQFSMEDFTFPFCVLASDSSTSSTVLISISSASPTASHNSFSACADFCCNFLHLLPIH